MTASDVVFIQAELPATFDSEARAETLAPFERPYSTPGAPGRNRHSVAVTGSRPLLALSHPRLSLGSDWVNWSGTPYWCTAGPTDGPRIHPSATRWG